MGVLQYKMSLLRRKYSKTLCPLFCCASFLVLILRILNPPIWKTMGTFQTQIQTDTLKRPHLILGIFSANGNELLRQGQRLTWINCMLRLKNKSPFRITYKFVIDMPTKNTTKENVLYKDIIHLNISTQQNNANRGEVLHTWLKHIYHNYPDAALGVKLDDDVFLCIPQIFNRLFDIMSPNLYYGWKHDGGRETHSIDEMFVVLGQNLIQRVASGTFCRRGICNGKEHPIQKAYKNSFLAEWLSVYNDVDLRADNNRMVRCELNAEDVYENFIKADFCAKQFLFHKSTHEIMVKLQQYNDFYIKANINHGTDGSVTGSFFSGQIERSVPTYGNISSHLNFVNFDNFTNCNNWAVVTTIFAPAKAVKFIMTLPQWCLVIVADISTPSRETYFKHLEITDTTNKKIKYLSILDQALLYPLLSQIIPIKHFGRKNIGYVYAIHHKAKFIWDFDDDNIGVFDLDDLPSTNFVSSCKGEEYFLINPYPYFGITENIVWPRGFPLQHIKDNRTIPIICPNNSARKSGVIQSLANIQPDVDAIFRLTRNVPFNFLSRKETHPPFVLPQYTYAPFNAQSALWMSSAFEYMPLPISVNGRVSDIWRSYIAQYFFHKKNLSLTFSVPYVYQERNEHNIIADFNAELDLYEKSLQLIILLQNNKYEDMQSIYEDLYRRKFIEKNDLDFIIVWQKTLMQIFNTK